jgi:hypothetical protein
MDALMGYGERFRAHLSSTNFLQILRLIAVIALVHLAINAVLVLRQWEDIQSTVLAPEYRFLFPYPDLRVAAYFLGPLPFYIVAVLLLVLVYPAVVRRQHP